MIGAILCLLALFVVGPIGLFLAGALWSAVFGWASSDEAESSAPSADTSAG